MEKKSLGRGISALIPPVKIDKYDKTAYLKLEESDKSIENNKIKESVTIKKVEIEPEAPEPNSTMRIYLYLNGTLSSKYPPIISYNEFINSNDTKGVNSGGSWMNKISSNKYFVEIETHIGVTEIWYIIAIENINEITTYENSIYFINNNFNQIYEISNLNYSSNDLKGLNSVQVSAYLNHRDIKDDMTYETEMRLIYNIFNPDEKLAFNGYGIPDSQWDNENSYTKYMCLILNNNFYEEQIKFQSKAKIFFRFYFMKDNITCISPSKTIIVT